MMVIGICGSSGSGKGYVCGLFRRYGFAHIDTDRLYREVVVRSGTPCLKELVDSFGNGILDSVGELNRKELSKLVFEHANAEKNRLLLNSITHKYILQETLALIEKYRSEGIKAVLVDAPVLFESGFDKICDITICVTASRQEKIKRIIARDKISEVDAIARLSAQKTDQELRELCDYEIDNSVGLSLEEQVKGLISKII
ncbi:MAG: dephospho-CoA kinase [Clostridia bacterium]|nr:dephospho-CoA kinase [Clostridia bacterium]